MNALLRCHLFTYSSAYFSTIPFPMSLLNGWGKEKSFDSMIALTAKRVLSAKIGSCSDSDFSYSERPVVAKIL